MTVELVSSLKTHLQNSHYCHYNRIIFLLYLAVKSKDTEVKKSKVNSPDASGTTSSVSGEETSGSKVPDKPPEQEASSQPKDNGIVNNIGVTNGTESMTLVMNFCSGGCCQTDFNNIGFRY